MTDYMTYWRERWEPGETAWFEYHCNESHDSEHAEWWYRSHQQVTVTSGPSYDNEPVADDVTWTFADRAEAGAPNCYEIRWADGFEGTVFEDELLNSPAGFERPAPPAAPAHK